MASIIIISLTMADLVSIIIGIRQMKDVFEEDMGSPIPLLHTYYLEIMFRCSPLSCICRQFPISKLQSNIKLNVNFPQ